MTDWALDTSAAIPYLMTSHAAHRAVRGRLKGRSLVLTGHSVAETYSVITRLPGDARVAPEDAVRLIDDNFGSAAILETETAARLPALLAAAGIAGGAVYDGLVALAAIDHELTLCSRDVRAAATYVALGAEVELIADGS